MDPADLDRFDTTVHAGTVTGTGRPLPAWRVSGYHHDLKTYKGWALVEGSGKRPMVPPDDPRHPRYKQNGGPR